MQRHNEQVKEMRKISKKEKGNMRVEREETWDITDNCKSLEHLEKGASIVERGGINHIDLQTQTKNE
jgi:hypothetical protein